MSTDFAFWELRTASASVLIFAASDDMVEDWLFIVEAFSLSVDADALAGQASTAGIVVATSFWSVAKAAGSVTESLAADVSFWAFWMADFTLALADDRD